MRTTAITASCQAPCAAQPVPVAERTALSVTVLTDRASLAHLGNDWLRLQARVAPLNPFLSWEWQWSWWEVFGADLTPSVLVFSAGDALRGILPLHRDPTVEGRLRIAGGLTLSDHLGFLAEDGWGPRVAAAAVDWAASQGRAAPQLDLHFLPDGSSDLLELCAAAAAMGLAVHDEPEETSPFVDVPQDFETYLETCLSKKDRHELRRKRRRLDQEQPGWRIARQEDLGLETALEHFFALHRASHPDKAAFLTAQNQDFFHLVAGRLERAGWLRLSVLLTDEGPVAATFGFTVDGVWHLYNSGYQPTAARWSVGLLCVAEGVRAAIAEGCRRCDFLRGNEPYKYDLGARDRVLHHLTVGGGAPTAADGGAA